jgi:hypothetical protein
MHLKQKVWVLMEEETATAGETCACAEIRFRIMLGVCSANDGDSSLGRSRSVRLESCAPHPSSPVATPTRGSRTDIATVILRS